MLKKEYLIAMLDEMIPIQIELENYYNYENNAALKRMINGLTNDLLEIVLEVCDKIIIELKIENIVTIENLIDSINLSHGFHFNKNSMINLISHTIYPDDSLEYNEDDINIQFHKITQNSKEFLVFRDEIKKFLELI